MPGIAREISIGERSSSSDSGKENAVHAHDRPSPSCAKNQKEKMVIDGSSFSTDSLSKLDQFIDVEDLPELLLVFDKGNITNRCLRGPNSQPLLYRRAYPKVHGNPVKSKNARRGLLFLDAANSLATGRRSSVHRAPLVATLGPRGEERKRVTVVAKTANDDCRSHHLLRQEGKAFAAFPREFFTDSKPVSDDALFRTPRPAMTSRSIFPGWGAAMRPRSPEPSQLDPPIAPKFYGFYIPVTSRGESLVQCHSDCKDFANSDCHVPNWPRSILLMEDCGEPIDVEHMALKQRKDCYDLVQRMHRQGFSHGHAHPRNMLAQPGPLVAPLADRSMDTPSFRLVSFGRWRGLSHPLPKESQLGAKRAFEKGREMDVCTAMNELKVGFMDVSDSQEDDY